MKYERPELEILLFDEVDTIDDSKQQASMNQEMQFFTGLNGQSSTRTTGIDVRKIKVNVHN